MRNFNWLIRLIFYQHQEEMATIAKTTSPNAIFYDVGYINQEHANLCTDACENMLLHFAGKPVATMKKNPRNMLEGRPINDALFEVKIINIDSICNVSRNIEPNLSFYPAIF